MELLLNPWVIIIVVLCVIIGNIAALKYTAKMKVEQWSKKTPSRSSETHHTSSADPTEPPSSSPSAATKKER